MESWEYNEQKNPGTHMIHTAEHGEVYEQHKKYAEIWEEHKFIVLKPCGHTEEWKTYADSRANKDVREQEEQRIISAIESGNISLWSGLSNQCGRCHDENLRKQGKERENWKHWKITWKTEQE